MPSYFNKVGLHQGITLSAFVIFLCNTSDAISTKPNLSTKDLYVISLEADYLEPKLKLNIWRAQVEERLEPNLMSL